MFLYSYLNYSIKMAIPICPVIFLIESAKTLSSGKPVTMAPINSSFFIRGEDALIENFSTGLDSTVTKDSPARAFSTALSVDKLSSFFVKA